MNRNKMNHKNLGTIADNKLCTGCSACIAGCSFDALSYGYDADGFYRPVLDETKCKNCGKCVKICPLCSTKHGMTRHREPMCYAFNGTEADSLTSSTAGGFQNLAKHFIQNGGKAVGVAWNKQFRAEHIFVETLDDLPRILKSKYVQSYLGDIFRQTKTELGRGTKILFSGTPCQIAGLYLFLGNDDANLYTVDMLCHAAPPAQLFERYLAEEFPDGDILEYQFRAKEPDNWRHCGGRLRLRLRLRGEFYREMLSDDWGRLFLQDVSMGKHCEQCAFADVPRQGDITIADFWCIEQEDPQFHGGGTEAVLVNSSKGEELRQIIKDKAVLWSQKPRQRLKNGNGGAVVKRKANPQRDRFFMNVRRMSVKQAARHAFENTYDIGLVGTSSNVNYGGALTYFALYHILKDKGKSVLLIDPPKDSEIWWLGKWTAWGNVPYSSFEVAPIEPNKTAMRPLNDRCEMFLVGSDQLFGTVGMYESCKKVTSLDWVGDWKQKAAFAASFATPDITCTDKERARMAYFLKKFDNFSVREKSGVELCRREFGIESEWVLDPVFLCRKQHYESLLTQFFGGGGGCGEKERFVLLYSHQNR